MSVSPPPASPAGWYADPLGRFRFRYWNGALWTEHVATEGGEQSTDSLEPSAPSVDVAAQEAQAGTSGRRRNLRKPVLITTLVVVGILIALLALGAIIDDPESSKSGQTAGAIVTTQVPTTVPATPTTVAKAVAPHAASVSSTDDIRDMLDEHGFDCASDYELGSAPGVIDDGYALCTVDGYGVHLRLFADSGRLKNFFTERKRVCGVAVSHMEFVVGPNWVIENAPTALADDIAQRTSAKRRTIDC